MDFRFYQSKISQNTVPGASKGCLEWAGGTSGNGYPYMKIDVDGNGVKQVIGVHRVVVMCHQSKTEFSDGLQVSHMCHNRRCVNINHLSLEPDFVNAGRNRCRTAGTCCGAHNSGGTAFANCIFSVRNGNLVFQLWGRASLDMSGLYVYVVIVYNNALQWGQATLDMFVGRSVFYYIFYDYIIIQLVLVS